MLTMKTIKFILPALATVAMAACTQEFTPQASADDYAYVVEATVNDDADTKLTFTDETGKVNVKWAASGEAFSAFTGEDAGSAVCKFTQVGVSSDFEKASFGGNLPDGTQTIHALYPAQETVAGSCKNVVLDFEFQKGLEIDPSLMYMAGTADVNGKKIENLSFNHLTSVLAINLDFGAGVNGIAKDIMIEGWEVIEKGGYDLTNTGSFTKLYPAPGSYIVGKVKFSDEFMVMNGKTNTLYYHFPAPNDLGVPKITARIGRKIYSFNIPWRSVAVEGSDDVDHMAYAGKVYELNLTGTYVGESVYATEEDLAFMMALYREGCYDRPEDKEPNSNREPNWGTGFSDGPTPGVNYKDNADGTKSVVSITFAGYYPDCYISKLPRKMNLPSLEEIYIWGDYTDLVGDVLPEEWNTPKLKTIKIQNKGMVGPIPAGLGASPELETVLLDGNNFTGPAPTFVSTKLDQADPAKFNLGNLGN